MDQQKRKDTFKKFVESTSLDPANWKVKRRNDWKIAKGYGASNSLIFAESGVEFMDAALEGIPMEKDATGNFQPGTPKAFVFLTSYRIDQNYQVFMALYVESDGGLLMERLHDMYLQGQKELSIEKKYRTYKDKHNNVAILLANHNRKLYLRNLGRWIETLPDEIEQYGPPISFDRVEYAVYPAHKNDIFVNLFSGRLATIFGEDIVHEIHPWGEQSGMLPFPQETRPQVQERTIKEISRSVGEGGFYPDGLVERLHIALNVVAHRHFAILTGLSGVGKTRLVQLYARAIHGIRDLKEEDPFLFICPVRPDWTDPGDLTGYYDVIAGHYVVPKFLEAVLQAIQNPGVPVIILLDEMNLARIEYYFSDVLSAMELGKDAYLELHTRSVPVESSRGGKIPRSIQLPHNLYIIGTVNIDETTLPISDKVLDRAQLIEMSDIRLEGFLDDLQRRHPELSESISLCRNALVTMFDALSKSGSGFGYRVAEELVRYVQLANRIGSRDMREVLDDLMAQKILVRLRGTHKHRDMLLELEELFVQKSWLKSKGIVEQLTKELDEFGSFQYSR